jgi:hypothetical protein
LGNWVVCEKYDLLKKIEDYQHGHRFQNRNKSIIELLERGLLHRKEEEKPGD